MSTYKEINGQKVQSLASDPPAPYTGQVWYNSSTNLLRARRGAVVSAWSTGGNMTTGRNGGGASTFGTPTATIAFAGHTTPGPGAYVSATESYNGSWTTLPYSLGALSYHCGGAGTSTSALKFGGINYTPTTPDPGYQNTTQVWSGSGWTSGPTMANKSASAGSAGNSNTSALAIGGGPDSSPSNETRCQIYNGAWTFGNNKNTNTRGSMAGGTATSAINAGGYDQPSPTSPQYKAYTESFNGTTWTSVADLNQGRANAAGCGASNTATIVMGGGGGGAGGGLATESWNGSAWTVRAVLPAEVQRNMASGNGSTNALSFGSNSGPTIASTNEFVVSDVIQTNTIPTS